MNLIWPDKELAEQSFHQVVETAPPELHLWEGEGNFGTLIQGDNMAACAALLNDYTEQIDLIYIDPPFAAGLDFRARVHIDNQKVLLPAYRDRWNGGLHGYLSMLYPRLKLFHRLLSKHGSIVVHCDWRVSHLIRLLLDEVFGSENFQNDICWAYGQTARGAKAIAKQFARNHDNLLWYTKGGKATFNGDSFYRYYTTAEAKKKGFRQDDQGRWFKTSPRGDYTDASIAKLEKKGRIYRTRTNKIRIKYFLETHRGSVAERLPIGDVWTDIPDAMHFSVAEQTGYATQKPQALLQRIITACSSQNDLIADFFCGSGTTLIAAEQLNRKWIGCDLGALAIQTTKMRLYQARAAFGLYGLRNKNSDLKALVKATFGMTEQGVQVFLHLPQKWLESQISPPKCIRFWSVGTLRNQSFIPLWQSSSHRQTVALKSEPVAIDPADICIQIVDIWGREQQDMLCDFAV